MTAGGEFLSRPEELAEFFRTRKIGFGRCLEPTMQYGQPEQPSWLRRPGGAEVVP